MSPYVRTVKTAAGTPWAARKRDKATGAAVAAVAIPPVIESGEPDFEVAFDAVNHVGSGTFGAFERIAAQVEGSGLFADSFLRRLEVVGHIDVARDNHLHATEWAVNAASLDQKNELLVKVYNRRPIIADEVVESLLKHADTIRPYIIDSGRYINDALDEGKVVLFEGAQAHHLDVDQGTYPYVTSSNPTASGATTGGGVGPTRIDRAIGIAKAYTTRVGEGPFPTELFDEDGDKLREIGGEFGATTGRPRRCGWFDAVLVEQACKINGFTDVFLTKLDILSGWDKIPVCVAYEVDGVRHDVMPMTQSDFHHAKPIYEYLDGWHEDISGARTFEDLPAKAQAYVHRLEELIGCRISGTGVGPGREQSVAIHDLI